ncbi:MAG: EscN/YscN/HrcN family type secretion system ATPase [Cyanobacteria bacterium RYN_339]|nr:EscN/YscN/HrcN family type secretion system ATPase [Cyanobacteria bacterium RYN_339]
MSDARFDYENYMFALKGTELIRAKGQVVQLIGLVIEALLQGVRIGELCYIKSQDKKRIYPAEVVGFKARRVLLMPLADIQGIGAGCEVIATNKLVSVKVGPKLLGRVVDGIGNPMDGKGPLIAETEYPLDNSPPNPIRRARITNIMPVGVRVIDGFLVYGEGQRMGLFAGSGVGKSTLLGMIARNAKADINVLCLVGERGREVNEFIEDSMGEEGMARSVVVCATSDMSSLLRMKAPMTASAIAEYFRDKGLKVFLMMDSVTRFAMAQREVGLAIGEPPSTKGYTPSVFAMLPRLLERAGMSDKGSITALYTVLVEGGDMEDPIADAVRGVLDGHIVMDRKIAQQNVYPAVDVLQSVSRLMPALATKSHKDLANQVRKMMADLREVQDMRLIGAYVKGSNQAYDDAIALEPQIKEFCAQSMEDPSSWEDTQRTLSFLGGGGSMSFG